jgi:hypothetical protein
MTSISAAGGSTINITTSGGSFYYDIDGGSPNPISWPVTISNTNTSVGFVEVLFASDMTLTSTNNYFVCGSSKIQFGSTSLNNDGTRRTITVTANNYDGLISNGSSLVTGYNDIYVYNLTVDGTGYATQAGAGWFGQMYFGRSATNMYFINCSSLGTINGGGILGQYSQNVTLIGCSSSGNIQNVAGGIVGENAISMTIQGCWSTGAISGDAAGGIVGSNSTSANIQNCYSTGIISGNNSGGIVGGNAGYTSVTINNCYSSGNITGANAGGICGSLAALNSTLTVSITNCYSTGNISNGLGTENGGICGALLTFSGSINLVINNCYTTGTVTYPSGYIIGINATINGTGSAPIQYTLTNNYSEAGSVGGTPGTWSNTHANSILTGIPSQSGRTTVGSTWITKGANTPYILFNMGYQPYSTTNISGTPDLIRTVSSTVSVGIPTSSAIVNGLQYEILEITGGTSSSYGTITISGTSGAISTSTTTATGIYTIYLYNIGSYNITTYTLTVNQNNIDNGCCGRPLDLKYVYDYPTRANLQSGNVVLSTFSFRRQAIPYWAMYQMNAAAAHKR